MDENQYNSDVVIPDAGIVKCIDGTFSVVKFVIETDMDTMTEELAIYTTQISTDELASIDAVNELDECSILFVKINYEFEFDEESGIMEMQLSRLVTLTDGENGDAVTAAEVIENQPEDLIPVYLDVIKSI